MLRYEHTRYDEHRGKKPPRGYGWGRHSYLTDVVFYYPIPLNLLVRWWDRGTSSFYRALWRSGLLDTPEGNVPSLWHDFTLSPFVTWEKRVDRCRDSAIAAWKEAHELRPDAEAFRWMKRALDHQQTSARNN